VRQVDSSLLDEWERLKDGIPEPGQARPERKDADAFDVTRDPKQFTVLVRNELYKLLRALSGKSWDFAAQITAPSAEPWTAAQFEQSLTAYWPEHGVIRLDPAARGPRSTLVTTEREGFWDVRQIITDPEDHNDWVIECAVDLGRSRAAAAPVISVSRIGT